MISITAIATNINDRRRDGLLINYVWLTIISLIEKLRPSFFFLLIKKGKYIFKSIQTCVKIQKARAKHNSIIESLSKRLFFLYFAAAIILNVAV